MQVTQSSEQCSHFIEHPRNSPVSRAQKDFVQSIAFNPEILAPFFPSLKIHSPSEIFSESHRTPSYESHIFEGKVGMGGQATERCNLWRAIQVCPSLVLEVLAPRGQELRLPQVLFRAGRTWDQPRFPTGNQAWLPVLFHQICLTCF